MRSVPSIEVHIKQVASGNQLLLYAVDGEEGGGGPSLCRVWAVCIIFDWSSTRIEIISNRTQVMVVRVGTLSRRATAYNSYTPSCSRKWAR